MQWVFQFAFTTKDRSPEDSDWKDDDNQQMYGLMNTAIQNDKAKEFCARLKKICKKPILFEQRQLTSGEQESSDWVPCQADPMAFEANNLRYAFRLTQSDLPLSTPPCAVEENLLFWCPNQGRSENSCGSNSTLEISLMLIYDKRLAIHYLPFFSSLVHRRSFSISYPR